MVFPLSLPIRVNGSLNGQKVVKRGLRMPISLPIRINDVLNRQKVVKRGLPGF